ncbi:MAG: hypothetical protein ACXW6T_28125, partial [Candidatus Binatia bacterium]
MKVLRFNLPRFSRALVLGTLLITSISLAQEAPAPAEVKVEAAPATAAPAETKKEDPLAKPAQFTQGLLEQIGGAKVALDTMWTLI